MLSLWLGWNQGTFSSMTLAYLLRQFGRQSAILTWLGWLRMSVMLY
jgi:hypothetical protein